METETGRTTRLTTPTTERILINKTEGIRRGRLRTRRNGER